MNELDATQRFSDRVSNYVRYRPRYPAAVIACLHDEAGLTPATAVADIGSGTGILTRLFLDNGNAVFAVEPNDAMRAAAERDLAAYPRFHSVNGAAEATTLPDASVGLIAAGQAFHWFDPQASRIEFARILAPGGRVALVWNVRRYSEPGFMAGYEAMLQRFGQSYDDVKQSAHMGDLALVLGEGYETRVFANEQVFDYAGLEGRLLSSSYAPRPGHPAHEPMLRELRALFDQHQRHGVVVFRYDTELYFGHPAAGRD